MSCRLVIITEIIAPYRIPVFNALARIPRIDPHVIFLADTDPTQRAWKIYREEIRFSYEVLPSWRARLSRTLYLLINRGMKSALRRAAPDLIVCGGYNYPSCWQAWLWGRRRNIPVLLWCESTARDRRSHQYLTSYAKRRFINSCSGFIVPGISSREYLASFGVPDEKIVAAPDAVDNALFFRGADQALADRARVAQELKLPEPYFLYVGRMVREKGIFDLLAAYEKMSPQARKKFSLVYVGDGPDRAELLQRAASIEPGNVHWAGFVHREQLPPYYALARALVLPTLSDPWGLVVNEAMACGLPVVVSDSAGCAADLVSDMWNGFVISPGDVTRLSSALDALAADSSLRSTMGQRSCERIAAYSPEHCAQGIAAAALRCQEMSCA